MLETYDFLAPQQIIFGWGRRCELPSVVQANARRAFVVSGSRTLERQGVLNEFIDGISRQGVECQHIATVSHEPEVSDVDQLVADLTSQQAKAGDCLLAIGGGSAIDLAKAASALVTNRESSTVKDYLEGVGAGLQITQPPLPLIAVPTTAGTGTEATKNAVISSYDPLFKKSLRSNQMIPRVVVVDPELSVGLPAQTTAFTGMDAITQLIESYVSSRAKPIPKALCLQGLSLAIPAIAFAAEHGQDVNHPATRTARTNMAHSALLSGMALANSGLGMAHGVAAALGVHAKVPHGQACAIMLPASINANLSDAENDYADIGRIIQTAIKSTSPELTDQTLLNVVDDSWNSHPEDSDDSRFASITLAVVNHLCCRLNIPNSLSEIGITPDQVPAIVKSSRGNSMSGNPREITDEELTEILLN